MILKREFDPRTETYYESEETLLFSFSGHWIVPACAPRMTPGNPFHTEPGAFGNAPFADRFDRILRTGGSMTAMRA